MIAYENGYNDIANLIRLKEQANSKHSKRI